MVGADGGVFSFGDAAFYGSTGGMRLNAPVIGMAPTPIGKGYWLVAWDGGVFSFGDARFYGSTGGMRLNRPSSAWRATPTGKGYWLVASDGGVFSFGDAALLRLDRRHAPRLAGRRHGARRRAATGYWLVASDGGVFTLRRRAASTVPRARRIHESGRRHGRDAVRAWVLGCNAPTVRCRHSAMRRSPATAELSRRR